MTMTEQNPKTSRLETALSIGAGLIGVGLVKLCLYEPPITPYVSACAIVGVATISAYSRSPKKFARNALATALVGSAILYGGSKLVKRPYSPSGIETQVETADYSQ